MRTAFHKQETSNAKLASQQNNFFFQPKLSINQSNDVWEQEADHVAEQVMSVNTATIKPAFFSPASIQRKCAACKEEEKNIQRKESNTNTTASSLQTENYISSVRGGEPLGNDDKSFFESRMGYDFSDVRIHDDSNANQSAKNINALAYTHGNDIVFDKDQYQPRTDDGRKLLAHELTHVIQQQNAPAIQRQEKPGKDKIDLQPNYYIALILRGFGASHDAFGMTQRSEQKFNASDMIYNEGMCLNSSSLSADVNFCRGAPNTVATPPIVALSLEYKEPGHFTSLKFTKRDEKPVPDTNSQRTCWQPNFPTHFQFDVYKKGTLKLTAELFGTDNNELNIYSDMIEIEKCTGSRKCREDAIATNRWLIIPDNGGPMHPLGPSDPDDGEHYEIYKETGTENYFICKGESASDKVYVDRRGYAL